MSPEPGPAAAAVTTAATVFRPAPLGASGTTTSRSTESDARARAAGYAAGWAAGARAAAEAAARRQAEAVERAERDYAERDRRLTEALGVLERVSTAAADRALPTLGESTRALHEAALELAAAVLGRELEAGEQSARAALDRALSLPPDAGPVTVRLHPQDLAQVRAMLAEGQLAVPAGTELVPDPGLVPGDAISELPHGYLDARIGSALERARRALLEDRS